jgi:hypothetical protein
VKTRQRRKNMELRKSGKERGEDRGFKPQRRAPKCAFYPQNNRVSIRSDDELMGHLPTTFPEFLSSILKMSFFRSGSWESVTADSLLLLNKLTIAESLIPLTRLVWWNWRRDFGDRLGGRPTAI